MDNVCINHPEEKALGRCVKCHTLVCANCLSSDLDNGLLCRECEKLIFKDKRNFALNWGLIGSSILLILAVLATSQGLAFGGIFLGGVGIALILEIFRQIHRGSTSPIIYSLLYVYFALDVFVVIASVFFVVATILGLIGLPFLTKIIVTPLLLF